MTNIRILPPDAGATTTINGRTYTCPAGSFLDAPDFDVTGLTANGWVMAASGGAVGTTAQRPTADGLYRGKQSQYFDTSLGMTIIWNGARWINPATGGAV